MSDEKQTADRPTPQDAAPDIARLRQIVEEHFPGLWPAVDLGLATVASLLLADNVDPVAVIYVGGPSSSKTTVADFFAGHVLSYVSDNFTPASFVSHAANVPRDKLAKVDLLPRIKHKLLVTPELAPIFRGKEAELAQRFAILTRVLDGDGLMTDSGTHGQRGYRGDYLFAWLGCTTPFDAIVWRVMAQLGSRLFFLLMDSEVEVTVEDLLESQAAVPYKVKLDLVRAALHAFLSALFEGYGGVRGVAWDASADPEEVRVWIARLAKLLATMRSEPVREGDPERGRFDYSPAKREQPRRAFAVLGNLARGHALAHGCRQLTADDLPILARVVMSSMPSECGPVFAALVKGGGEPLTVAQVQDILHLKHPDSARSVMEDLDGRGVMEFIGQGVGKPSLLRFRSQWAWCASPEFQGLLGEPLTRPEVCVSSPPTCQESGGVCRSHLSPITSSSADGREGVEENAHTPRKMTGSHA